MTLTLSVAKSALQLLGFWGDYSPPELVKVEQNQLISFNASGLDNYPDIWLKNASNRLILARDSFGRVPFYYLPRERGIWFASRIQLLLPLLKSPQVSIAALYGYSCFSYVPNPLSPVQEIFSIPAGVEDTWQEEEEGKIVKLSSRSLWEWREETNQLEGEAIAIARLQNLLQLAITRQTQDLTASEPVGVFLSGGLDSSIVAALLVQRGLKVRAYTLDFGKSVVSPETPYAETVAQALNIPLIKVPVTAKRVKLLLKAAIAALDVPFGDGVIVPLYLLNQAASQDVRVIFNGEGGDQLFAGWTNKPLIAASIYAQEHPENASSFEYHYLKTFHRLWGYEEQVFQSSIYNVIKDIMPQQWLKTALDSQFNPSLLHRLRRATLMLKGAQNIQPRASNLALTQGLQVRSPFTDFELAQETFRLSGTLFLQGSCEKYILKKAVESWLPSEIVWRSKQGMRVPLTTWCLRDWWHSLGSWLNPGVLEAEGRWQNDIASRVAFGNLGGLIHGRRIGEILWLLIVWQIWRTEVLGEVMGKESWRHPFWTPYQVWRYSKKWF